MVDRFAEQCCKLVEFIRQHLRCLSFDIQSQQRLGIARANIEPPVLELHGDTIQIALIDGIVECRPIITQQSVT